MIVISGGTAAVLFGMAGIKTVPGTIVFALLYGFFSGGCELPDTKSSLVTSLTTMIITSCRLNRAPDCNVCRGCVRGWVSKILGSEKSDTDGLLEYVWESVTS